MSGVKYLLDTNIIIGLLARNSEVLQLLQTINIDECAYSAITRMELLSYPKLSPHEQQGVEQLLNHMTHLSLSTEIENATILFRKQHQTKLPDSIIAATARHHQLQLVTLDAKLAQRWSV